MAYGNCAICRLVYDAGVLRHKTDKLEFREELNDLRASLDRKKNQIDRLAAHNSQPHDERES
jgi:hypothetical protein